MAKLEHVRYDVGSETPFTPIKIGEWDVSVTPIGGRQTDSDGKDVGITICCSTENDPEEGFSLRIDSKDKESARELHSLLGMLVYLCPRAWTDEAIAVRDRLSNACVTRED